MGLFDNGFKLGTGLAVGIGTVFLAPVIVPVVGQIAKPMVKATIKGGLLLAHKGRQMIAEAVETVEDLAAEAKAELIAESISASASEAQTEAVDQTG